MRDPTEIQTVYVPGFTMVAGGSIQAVNGRDSCEVVLASRVTVAAFPGGPTGRSRTLTSSSTNTPAIPFLASFSVNAGYPPGRQGATPALRHQIGRASCRE